MEVITLTDLPYEILERIAFRSTLNYGDVANLRFCCKVLHSVILSSNALWKQKFLQKWETCIQPEDHIQVVCWRALYQLRLSLQFKLPHVVRRATELLMHKDEAPRSVLYEAFSIKDRLFSEDFLADCIIDELHRVCTPIECPPLSLQFYSVKLLELLQIEVLKRRWEIIVEKAGGVESVSTEDTVNLVHQWSFPGVDHRHNDFDQWLHKTSHYIISSISSSHKSIVDKACSLSLPRRPEKRVVHSPWTVPENSILMEAVLDFAEKFIHSQVCFRTDILHHFLDPRREVSADDLLTVVLAASLGERLGLCCEVTSDSLNNYPVVLTFRNHESPNDDGCSYFAFRRTRLRRYTYRDPEAWCSLDAVDAHRKMALYRLIESFGGDDPRLYIDELKLFLKSNDVHTLARVMWDYCKQEINLTEVPLLKSRLESHTGDVARTCAQLSELVSGVDELSIPDDIPIRSRSDPIFADVKFAVGMIMFHTKYEYSCLITGWTPVCEATKCWIVQMGVDTLPRGPSQPFYNVLVPDGSQRYAAQENLCYHDAPLAITHDLVGKYMQSFEGTHYLMHAAQEKYYPEDSEYTASMARERYKHK